MSLHDQAIHSSPLAGPSLEEQLTTDPHPLQQFKLGNRWKRFAAWIIDWIIFIVILSIITAAFGLHGEHNHVVTHYYSNGQSFTTSQYGLFFSTSSAIIGIVLFTAYNVLFDIYNHGSTPGKAAMGLRVIMTDGTRITPGAAIMRELVGKTILDFIPIIYWLVDNIFILGDSRRQAIHDKLASTLVVEYRQHYPKSGADLHPEQYGKLNSSPSRVSSDTAL